MGRWYPLRYFERRQAVRLRARQDSGAVSHYRGRLAAMAGIARDTLSRILNDWQRRNLVSRLSGYYCIEDKAQLQKEAEL